MSEVILPDDPAYDSARAAWNLAADQRPAGIALAESVDEIVTAVRWARENGLKIAAQTTGHGAVALPDLGGSLLLKVNLFDDNIDIDSSTVTAKIPAGTTVDQIVQAAAERGMAFLHGSSPSVGVIGYLLGGGLSTYGRSGGLACNRVISFELVTEDGEIVKADSVTNPDLFWALRGGGGGLGVVISVEVELMNMAEVFAGATFLPVSVAAEALDAWIEWARTAPEAATTTFRILRFPPFEEVPEQLRGQTLACIDGVSLDQVVGEDLAALCESFGEPVLGGWGIQPVADVARLHGDPETPVPGLGVSAMLSGVDESAARAFIEAAGENSPTTLVVAEIRHIGGALARSEEDSGILDHLEGEFLLFATGIAAGPEMAAKAIADGDQLLAAMRPWTVSQKFFSFTERDFELAECLPESSLDRLRQTFDRHSPDRSFVVARSIDD